MADRTGRRRVLIAVIVSTAVHAVVAAVVWWAVSQAEPDAPASLPLSVEDADSHPFRLALTTDGEKDRPPPAVNVPPPSTSEPTGRPPVVHTPRPPLSDAVRDAIAASLNRPPEPTPPPVPVAARVPVVEVADVTPVEHREPVAATVTDVSPAAPPMDAKPPMEVPGAKASAAAEAVTAAGKPLHGAMPDGKSVVYVLDRSTSMADRDTFLAARGAVAASAGGSFQVVVYNGKAQPLLAGTGNGLLAASPETMTAVAEALAALKPEGRSDHAAGLRAALRFKPDFVILVTDADDDELVALLPLLKAAERPVTTYCARAANGAVAKPQLLK